MKRILLITFLVIVAVLLYLAVSRPVRQPLVIILSPHFDDAVLSLGGLLAKRQNQVLVATFFTRKSAQLSHTEWDKMSGFRDSNQATAEREKENNTVLLSYDAIIKNYPYQDFQYRKDGQDVILTQSIANDIEYLLAQYRDREIYIYGPATFGIGITHPDHQIVHDALMFVTKMSKSSRVHFYMYEDMPYAKRFADTGAGSLNAYLQLADKQKFVETNITLTKPELSEKISSIKKYVSQIRAFRSLGEDIGLTIQTFAQSRCGSFFSSIYACEVVHAFEK